jgi:hypothetical protein
MKMIQANSLDKVIREVDAKTKANSPDEKVVIIDRKKWQVIPKKAWKHWFGGDLAFYLVSNNNDPSNIADRKTRPYYLTYFTTGEKLGISITYWASCEPRNEEKVAEALCRGNTLGEALDKKIEKWIAQSTKNDASVFLDNYSRKLRELEEFIKINVKEEVGINLELRLALEKETQLKPFAIPSFPMDVYVSDCDEPLELHMKTELIVDEGNKIKAILNDVNDARKWQELVKLFKREVKNYLLHHITINQFSYELKDTVRNKLVLHLDSILINYGRKVGYLSLSSYAVASTKQLVQIKCKVECEVQKYSESIFIENSILMLPLNTARYKPNQASKLESWVESKLEKIIKPLMLKKKYIDVLLDFEEFAEQIKEQMQEEAKSIGYEVNQIISVPNLEHLELKENFDIEFSEGTFTTKDANVKVVLGVSATVKILDFTNIEDYLKPKVKIKELIKETIYTATSQLLNTVEPERYYMRFYQPGVDDNGHQFEDKSVEQELIEAVKQTLEKRFKAQVSRITTNVHHTEIAKHFNKLYGMIGFFKVEVSSLADIEEAVTYQGDFQIEGVETNSWYTFQARQPEIDDIRQSIERRLNARLSTFSKVDLQGTDLEYLSLIEGLINQWARDSVVEQFGLKIRIINLSRLRTEQEKLLAEEKVKQLQAYREARQKQLDIQGLIASETNEFKLQELKTLKQKRLDIITQEDNQDEIEDLDDKIRVLEKEALISSMEEAASNVIKPKMSKFPTPSLREIAEKAKVQGSKNNPALSLFNDTDIPQLEEKDSE